VDSSSHHSVQDLSTITSAPRGSHGSASAKRSSYASADPGWLQERLMAEVVVLADEGLEGA